MKGHISYRIFTEDTVYSLERLLVFAGKSPHMASQYWLAARELHSLWFVASGRCAKDDDKARVKSLVSKISDIDTQFYSCRNSAPVEA